MLRAQLECFFPGQSRHSAFDEFDENSSQGVASLEQGVGGVWVRKPRSSRKGSGGAYLPLALADMQKLSSFVGILIHRQFRFQSNSLQVLSMISPLKPPARLPWTL